jgi:biotin carboxyl carrier protein
MKKIYILTASVLLLISCGKKEESTSIEKLIETKNVKALQEKKVALQTEITQIETALATLDTNKEEALVSVAPVKDTLFNHYLDIQGSVNTKENILVQPEFSGTLTSLTVKAGDHVTKGQVLGRVDDAGMSQQLANAENQYALAKTTFERQKNQRFNFYKHKPKWYPLKKG